MQNAKKQVMLQETHSESDTAMLASTLAQTAKAPSIYALYGDLGAGKSVFSRGFIRALAGENTEVPSPTFTLLQTYETNKGIIYHYDLYRIEDPEEIYELGWEEALAEGIILLEWPQRLGNFLPEVRTDITFTTMTDTLREIEIYDHAG